MVGVVQWRTGGGVSQKHNSAVPANVGFRRVRAVLVGATPHTTMNWHRSSDMMLGDTLREAGIVIAD